MSVTKSILPWPFLFLFAGFLALGTPAHSQATKEQMQTLVPGEQELQGFVHVNRDGVPPLAPVEDIVALNLDAAQLSPGWAEMPGSKGTFSYVVRNMRSVDGRYKIRIDVTVCDSPQTAQQELKAFLSEATSGKKAGSLTSDTVIGDESWVEDSYDRFHTLLFRFGSLIVMLQGSGPRVVTPAQDFLPAAVEAVAYQTLLRASQQAALIGVSAQTAQLTINGHAQPKGALKVAGRVYVPVKEFARAMGLTSGWDAKTGALTLTGAGHKAVALTAGSTQATVGGAKAAALAVPVLKDGGEPVMALSDLLTLTGGRITGHAGNTVQVKG